FAFPWRTSANRSTCSRNTADSIPRPRAGRKTGSCSNTCLEVKAVEPRPALIRVRGASKTYRAAEGDITSLTPLDFDIREGEFLSVVGPSGCGKSTLLKMIGGLL